MVMLANDFKIAPWLAITRCFALVMYAHLRGWGPYKNKNYLTGE